MAAGTVAEALASAADALRAAGVETPRLDAELLLSEATGTPRERLAIDPEGDVSGAEARAFGVMVRRRIAREPLAYIVGRRGFRHLEIAVDARALIPRPETELLVEIALEVRPTTVLDVGTGSGAVALSIADEMPEASIVAIDVSEEALALANANATALGLGDRIDLRLGTAGEAVVGETFDLVVANLPYVAEVDRDSLEPEITGFEPAGALFSGPDGLDAIRGLVAELARRGGVDAGAVALEVGEGQAGEVSGLLAGAGFERVEVRPDLAGIDRVVSGRR